MASPIINIKFLADLQQFSSQMQNVNRQLDKTGRKFQNIGKTLSVGLTLPLLAAGGASVKYASDFEESLNKVGVAFGNSSGEIQAFAKTSLQQFGIAEGSALDMAALFGDMATSMQIPQKEAAKMSTALVGLAGDLASFKNIGIDEATTALNGVFTGETESLKRLGVVMTQANLAQFAMSKGIKTNIKDMSEAEKVQLRYAYIMDRTTNAQGDFNNTSGGAANQMRIFQESLKQVGQQFGSVILPVFTKAVSKVNEIITYISGLNSETKKTIVIGAAFAAALGPVVVVLGTLIRNVATLTPLVKTLTVAIAANPIGAFAIAIGALAGGLLLANSRFTPLTNATEEFNKLTAVATQSIAQEKVQLDKLLRVAQDEKQSKEARAKAIEGLNKLSPEYLGNLSLENINTTAAKDATDAYTASLIKKAKVMAAEEKLVEVQKKLLDLQTGQSNAGQLTFLQNLKAVALGFGDVGKTAAAAGAIAMENFNGETAELLKLQAALTDFIGTNNEVPTTSNKEITITPTINLGDAKIDGKLSDFNANGEFIGDLFDIEKAQESFNTLDGLLNNTKQNFADAAQVAQENNFAGILGNQYTEFLDKLTVDNEKIITKTIELTDALGSAIKTGLGSAAETFGVFLGNLASGGVTLGNLFQGLIGVVADFMAALGKSLIQTGVAAIAFKKLFANPVAAIAAGALLIGFSTVVKNMLIKGPQVQAFADGGIVSGPTLALVGEYAGASNNPEVIAPLDKLKGLMQPGGATVFIPDVKISGRDLKLVFNRQGEYDNRIG